MAKRIRSSEIDKDKFDMVDLMFRETEDYQMTSDTIIDTPEKFEAVIEQVMSAKKVSLDTETTGLKPDHDAYEVEIEDIDPNSNRGDMMVGFSFAFKPNKGEIKSYYCPTAHYYSRILPKQMYKELLDCVISREEVFMHNAYFDLGVLAAFYNYNVWDTIETYDTLSAIHTIIQGEDKRQRGTLGLKGLAYKLFNIKMKSFDSDTWKGFKILRAPIEELGKYAAHDAYVTYLLGEYCKTECAAQGTKHYVETVGKKLVNVLVKAHTSGLRVDRPALIQMSNNVKEALAKLDIRLRELSGNQNINFRSKAQLDTLFYDELRMPLTRARGKSGSRPVGAEVISESLSALKNFWSMNDDQCGTLFPPVDDKLIEIVSIYKDFTNIQTINNTFITPILKKSEKTGYINPELYQTGTTSGRLASRDPNGQNFPSARKSQVGDLSLDIRSIFIPDDGHMFSTNDESALEMRILAHETGEESLVKALHLPTEIEIEIDGKIEKVPGPGDPHSATACKLFNYVYDQFIRLAKKDQKKLRNEGKTCNFAVIYGRGPEAMAEQMGITVDEAKAFIQLYFDSFPRVSSWKMEKRNQILKYGEIRTILNRTRRTSLHKSNITSEVEHCIRSLINANIQGGAADVVNSAMTRIYADSDFKKMGAKILLQVHDELVVTAKAEYIEDAHEIVQHYMRNPFPDRSLRVPLMVDGNIGERWIK